MEEGRSAPVRHILKKQAHSVSTADPNQRQLGRCDRPKRFACVCVCVATELLCPP